MGTKTIGLREDVYKRLKAHKREGESFTDTVGRLLEESNADWREGFGTLPNSEAAELETVARGSREQLGDGIEARQQEAIDALAAVSGDDDETA
jgi:predicted CopG family antitoxin